MTSSSNNNNSNTSHLRDSFSQKQNYVKQAAFKATFLLGSVFSLVYCYQPTFLVYSTRIHYFATFIPAAFFYAYCIGNIVVMRANDPALIDGSAYTNLDPSKQANAIAAVADSMTQIRIAQAILQNTLEQTVLLAMVHTIWILCLPVELLVLQPVAMAVYLIGRVLFARGYKQSTHGRAQGFALTILSTGSLLAIEMIWLCYLVIM